MKRLPLAVWAFFYAAFGFGCVSALIDAAGELWWMDVAALGVAVALALLALAEERFAR